MDTHEQRPVEDRLPEENQERAQPLIVKASKAWLFLRFQAPLVQKLELRKRLRRPPQAL